MQQLKGEGRGWENYLKDFPAEQATNKNAKNANHLLIKCTSAWIRLVC